MTTLKLDFHGERGLSLLVEHSGSRHLNNVHFFSIGWRTPAIFMPRYHVNTPFYSMANKYRWGLSLMNATIIQEDETLAKGILSSKYFEDLKKKLARTRCGCCWYWWTSGLKESAVVGYADG